MPEQKSYAKMTPSVKAEWITELRSGNYSQGKEYLCRVDPDEVSRSYCCLGVLAEIALRHGIISAPTLSGNNTMLYAGDDQFLNDTAICGWSGIASSGGFNESEVQDVLVNMNDGTDTNDDGDRVRTEPKTFAEIADWIEENL